MFVQTNPKLYLNLLELEYSGDVSQNEAEILVCFDRAVNSAMSIEARLLFCQRKVEFLEDFGSDINMYVGCFFFVFFKKLICTLFYFGNDVTLFFKFRLVAAYEEQQKLQKEDEASKTKAENGYDRSGHVKLLIVTIQTQKCNWFSQDCVPGVAEIEN